MSVSVRVSDGVYGSRCACVFLKCGEGQQTASGGGSVPARGGKDF